MANILDIISAVTPMGGTITKLRVLMTGTNCHHHVLYHPGFIANKTTIEKELIDMGIMDMGLIFVSFFSFFFLLFPN